MFLMVIIGVPATYPSLSGMHHLMVRRFCVANTIVLAHGGIVKWKWLDPTMLMAHRFCVLNTIVLAHDRIVKWKRLDPTMLQVREEHLLATQHRGVEERVAMAREAGHPSRTLSQPELYGERTKFLFPECLPTCASTPLMIEVMQLSKKGNFKTPPFCFRETVLQNSRFCPPP